VVLATIKILFIGEIVGKCGVFCVKMLLPKIKKEYGIDFVIANGDGATKGFGLGKNHAIYLHKLGINVLTSGECIYYKRDMVEYISKATYILRPANYPKTNPGRGWMIYQINSKKIAIISLLGQAGFARIHLGNPFYKLEQIIKKVEEQTKIVIVDFHAATTSEKYTMFHNFAGKISAIMGSHGKVLTADATIFKDYTAVICDVGRTGSQYSVGGLDSEIEIRKYLTQIPEYSNTKCKQLALQGVVLEIDEQGKALSIDTIKRECKEEFRDRERNSIQDK